MERVIMSGIVKKILFVEDDPVVLTLYRNRLQREGFEVLFAEDGQVALSVLVQAKPDLVVLDLMLPKVNGVEVLKHIRADANLRGTPVLILSNAYLSDMANKAMQSGANKGMLKTECTPAKLVEAIQDLLGALPAKPSPARSQAEAFVAAAAAAHADEASIKATRDEFIQDAPTEVGKIREHCLAYIKAGTQAKGLQRLNQLYQRVHFLSARAALADCTKVALLASALEALLFEVVFKPEATPSILQTIAQAVDSLEHLIEDQNLGTAGVNLKARILVVDDDAVCNYTMVAALRRAHFEPVAVEDPAVAMRLVQAGHFDVVLLDINMPGMSGFELCEALRQLPQYRETPVIFITGNGDFQNRAQGILSGGNDLITKPTSSLELVLKTTMHLLHPQARRTEPATGEVAVTTANALPTAETDGVVCETAPPELPPVQEPVFGETSPPSEAIKWIVPQGTGKPIPPAPADDSSQPEAQTEAAQPESNGAVPPDAIPQDVLLGTTNGSRRSETANGMLQPAANGTERHENNETGPRFGPGSKPRPAARRTPLSEPGNVQPLPPARHEKHDSNMKKTPTSTFDEVADGVSRIIFGDENLTDMNVRLTRIALERYNVSEGQSFEEMAQAVARIIFGDENLTDMNVRLTRIALERYNIPELLNRPAEAGQSSGRAPHLAAVSL